MALASICGDRDVCAPFKKKNPRKGEEAYQPQNFRGLFVPKFFDAGGCYAKWKSELRDSVKLRKFKSHMTAEELKRRLPSRVWNDYLKITIERNPWDIAVSEYFWTHRRNSYELSFEEWMRQGNWRGSQRRFYSVNGEPCVDRFLRFESLADDFQTLCEDLGLVDVPTLPTAKSGFRKDEGRFWETHTPYTRQLVAENCAWEIEKFGYAFDEAST